MKNLVPATPTMCHRMGLPTWQPWGNERTELLKGAVRETMNLELLKGPGNWPLQAGWVIQRVC